MSIPSIVHPLYAWENSIHDRKRVHFSFLRSSSKINSSSCSGKLTTWALEAVSFWVIGRQTHRLMVLSRVRGLAGPPMYLFPNWEAVPRGQPVVERLGGTIDISGVKATTLKSCANHRRDGLIVLTNYAPSYWKIYGQSIHNNFFIVDPSVLFLFRNKCVVLGRDSPIATPAGVVGRCQVPF